MDFHSISCAVVEGDCIKLEGAANATHQIVLKRAANRMHKR